MNTKKEWRTPLKQKTKPRTDSSLNAIGQNNRIIELVTQLFELNNEDLNDGLKDVIIEANSEIKELTKNNDTKLLEILRVYAGVEDVSVLQSEAVKEKDDEEIPKKKEYPIKVGKFIDF